MTDPLQFWSPDDESQGGSQLSEQAIQDAATRLGVSFPDAFARLYSAQNGGRVRDEDLTLFPLPTSKGTGGFGVVDSARFIAEDDEFARELVLEELGDPQLVVLIAGDDGHTYHALDFNPNGPQGEPRVVWLDFECSEWSEVSPTFSQFVEELMQSDDECAVDLGEIKRLRLVAHETIDYEYENGMRDRVDQHLCDAGNALILFVDNDSPDGLELSRVEIARPLDADSCIISPLRPAPHPTWMLMLHSEVEDGILWTSSRRTGDGRWKNGTCQGTPIYASFESSDKSRLKDLRTKLLGGDISERAAAQEEWQERMEDMSEDEMEAAFPHLMLQMMGEMEELVGNLDPDATPDELRPAIQRMELLKSKMKADLEQRAAGTAPPSDELLDLVKQMMPHPEDFSFDD